MMNEIRHRAIYFLYAIPIAYVALVLLQWGVGLFDWHIAYPWNKVVFAVLTILFWAPWRKPPLPKPDNNNDPFSE